MNAEERQALLDDLSILLDRKRFAGTNEVVTAATIEKAEHKPGRDDTPILDLTLDLKIRVRMSGADQARWRIDRLLRSTGITRETYEKTDPRILVGHQCQVRLGMEEYPPTGARHLRVVDFEL